MICKGRLNRALDQGWQWSFLAVCIKDNSRTFGGLWRPAATVSIWLAFLGYMLFIITYSFNSSVKARGEKC